MSKDLNRVELLGHLGSDPELRYLETGTALATFSVATSRRWTDAAGQDQEETEWTRVAAWGKVAEIAGQYLHKGSRLFLQGRLKTRSWNDTETGERRSATEVIADDLIMLDGRSSMPARADDRDPAEADVPAAEAGVRVPPRTVRSAAPAATATGASKEDARDRRP